MWPVLPHEGAEKDMAPTTAAHKARTRPEVARGPPGRPAQAVAPHGAHKGAHKAHKGAHKGAHKAHWDLMQQIR